MHSFKLMYLSFTLFPERTQSPMTCKRLLHTCQYIIPRSSVSTDSFEEESCREACSTPISSGERDEDSLSFTLREKVQKRVSKAPKQAWSSPFLELKMANKPSLSHSEHPVYLETASRHTRLQSQFLCNSKRNSGKYQLVTRFSFLIATYYFLISIYTKKILNH